MLTLTEFTELIDSIHHRLHNGCGNHSCVVKKPTGQATNGACRCTPMSFARDIKFIANELPINWPVVPPKFPFPLEPQSDRPYQYGQLGLGCPGGATA